MKFPSIILLFFMALVGPVLCATKEAAYERLYFYVLYDMECEVWGVGRGFIAVGCNGSGKDGRCNFNEFINFIQFGTESDSPSYYDLPSDFYLQPGTAGVMVQALIEFINEFSTSWDRVIVGRKDLIGLYTDLGHTLDETRRKAATLGINTRRFLDNALLVMGAISQYRDAALNPKILKQMASSVKDVLWQIANKEIQDFENGQSDRTRWQEIDWQATVEKNPALSDPNGNVYKEVGRQLSNFYTDKGNAYDLTIKYKVGNSIRLCYYK